MARIAGVDLPRDKRIVIGLTYIFGIGNTTAQKILANAGVSEDILLPWHASPSWVTSSWSTHEEQRPDS